MRHSNLTQPHAAAPERSLDRLQSEPSSKKGAPSMSLSATILSQYKPCILKLSCFPNRPSHTFPHFSQEALPTCRTVKRISETRLCTLVSLCVILGSIFKFAGQLKFEVVFTESQANEIVQREARTCVGLIVEDDNHMHKLAQS